MDDVLAPTKEQLGWMGVIAKGDDHFWPKGSIWDTRQAAIDAGFVTVAEERADKLRLAITDLGRSFLDAASSMSLADRLAAYTPGDWFQCRTVDEMQAFYLSRLPAMRDAAKAEGYALGLHGSTRRDMDLIAVPWRADYADKDTLARAIQLAACGISMSKYTWEQKPAGREAVSVPICWTDWHDMVGAGHVDLSVVAPQIFSASAVAEICAKVADKWKAYWADFSQTTCAPTHDSRGGGITYGRIQAAETIAKEIRETIAPQNNGGANG